MVGTGVGLAVAAAPGIAQATTSQADADTSPPALVDPKTRYPKPPFKKQSQPWPGLPADGAPPDHGETSYQGSGRLDGRKALITGGDSGIGGPRRSPSPARAPTSRSTTCPTRRPTPAR